MTLEKISLQCILKRTLRVSNLLIPNFSTSGFKLAKSLLLVNLDVWTTVIFKSHFAALDKSNLTFIWCLLYVFYLSSY